LSEQCVEKWDARPRRAARAGAGRAGGGRVGVLPESTELSMPSVLIVIGSQEAFVVLRLTKLSGWLRSGRNFAAPLAANLQRVRQASEPSSERGSTERRPPTAMRAWELSTSVRAGCPPHLLHFEF